MNVILYGMISLLFREVKLRTSVALTFKLSLHVSDGISTKQAIHDGNISTEAEVVDFAVTNPVRSKQNSTIGKYPEMQYPL